MASKILKSISIGLVIIAYIITTSDGQACIINPDVSIPGGVAISVNRQFIMPNFNFSCNGRITSVAASLYEVSSFGSLPVFQVWRPLSPGSSAYSKIGQVQFEINETRVDIPKVSLTGNDQIEFQSGDVIGCYQPINSHYRVGYIIDSNYVSYFTSNSSFTTTTINVSSPTFFETKGRPLISVMLDVRCDNLSISNGGIGLCSSGRVGVGYEGDTCNFTCETGFELIGSETRTCQSDGSWSGTDGLCRRVWCPPLTDDLNDGMLKCSLGDDGVPSYGDNCIFTCNTGYKLTGSDTRTCQSNGSWNGTDSVCKRIQCSVLNNPINGIIKCVLGDDQAPSYEDTCNFTCNTGYELIGSDTTICQSNGKWYDANIICRRVTCSSLTNLNGIFDCSLGDDGIPSYEDTCSFTCNTGYELIGSDTRTCQSDGSWNGTGGDCRRVQCSSLNNPNNGTISCSLGDDGVISYEDTCNFTCNIGYELTGSDIRTCQSDGYWSGTDSVCRRDTPLSSSSSGSTDERVIISASIGGVILLLMLSTVVLCIVILYMKNPHKKKKAPSFVKASFSTTKLHSNNASEHDTSYNIIEVTSSTIKRGDLADVSFTVNPSYGIPIKSYYSSKPSEDEYSYVQPDEFNQHSDLDGSIKMQSNPSYGVCIIGDGLNNSVIIEACQSLHVEDDATVTEYDYAYAHNNHLLCQTTEENSNSLKSVAGDGKEESHANVDQSDNNYLPLIF